MSTLKEDLDVLAKMTKALNEIPHYFIEDASGVIEYEVAKGTCYVKKVFGNNRATILRSFMSDNTEFSPHTHAVSTELFCVYRGILEICIGDDCIVVEAPGTYQMGPGIEHSVRTIGDTEVVVVLTPPEEDYPNGRG